nr:immunoglobulin light chain junction region [Macaca mulatta]
CMQSLEFPMYTF